jgi:predicted ATPase
VAKDAGFDPQIIIMEIVGTVRAKQIESQVLKMGKPVFFKRRFAGSSEFRHLSSEELEDVIEIIRAG